MDKNLFEFNVQIYGQLEKYNEVLSKARCRIFYKYENRNQTYITDEFAEKLLKTVSYAPIKGIYQDIDYTDHGISRDQGRIYGIVPESPNIAWEDFLDKDGVTRTYACVDVLIFSALYEEAKEIVGKGQSMELYPPSLKYHKATIQGKNYIVFDEGCFLGLQVLGDDVEPCFEGASFYTLQNTIEYVIKKIKQYGGSKVPNPIFKISDEEKANKIWDLLNPNYNEEGNWTVTYGICKVYDEYTLVIKYEEDEYYRAYYNKNDENDTVTITDFVKVYVLDLTEKERSTLDTLRVLNGDTYDLVSEVIVNAQENYEKVEAFSSKIEELNNSISTLETERDSNCTQINEYSVKLEDANNTINSLNEELNSLREYKNNIEIQEKQNVLNEYSAHLSEEILNSYKEKISEYSAEELDMHLAYELKKTNSSVFSKKDEGYVPKEDFSNGLTAILSKYKK